MGDELADFLRSVQEDEALFQLGEEATKQGAILPILSRLGWDRDNIREVVPEYSAGTGRVDYCLRLNDQNLVFLEAKRINEDLHQHQEQLLEYAFRHGVRIALLTNGLIWWFYLPLSPGSWEQRRFFTIDIQKQDVGNAAEHFRQFLARDALADDSAFERAKRIHASREKQRRVESALPKAWREMCTQPDETLVERLAEYVESVCGHRPDQDMVARFLARAVTSGASGAADGARSGRVRPSARMPEQAPSDGKGGTADTGYTFRKPVAFQFVGEHRSVRTFKEVLIGVCEVLHARHGAEFSRVLGLKGRKRPYFSTDGREMHEPRQIGSTGIYVETTLSANAAMQRCEQLLGLFDYPKDALQIEFADKQRSGA